MESLAARMKAANSLLAPYAVPHGGELGRRHSEEEDPTRFPFQRDRDRIVSTDAFRRLAGKMQVLPPGFSDHIRNRGTHTIETANLSRTIARALRLNEDLAECIALAHDIGHPPFGHSGEEALNESHEGGFEHNAQSLRIVTLLEQHSDAYTGINLSIEILEGMVKHRKNEHGIPRSLSLEAQIVDLADAATYTAHDIEDGLDAKILSLESIRSTDFGERAVARAKERSTRLRGGVLDLLMTDLYTKTERCIRAFGIQSLADVYSANDLCVSFSDGLDASLRELRQFLWDHFYLHPTVREKAQEGMRIVTKLYEAYRKNPPEKVIVLQRRTDSDLLDAVKDYIAGMTDEFAAEAHSRL